MKKLLMGLFVFSFLFVGFQINATDEGCSDGVIFSSTTGARCLIGNNPIISGISGPQLLNVGQTGTWEVKASDPNGRSLTYSVVWNMERCGSTSTGWCGSKEANQNSLTFTHSFSSAGSYDIGFIAQNDLDFNSGLADTLKIIHVEVKPVSVDNGCSNNQVYSSTTGQVCKGIVIEDNGCKGSIYSLTTGKECPASTITTEAGCGGLNIYSLTTGQVCPVDEGCNGTNYSTTTGKACPAVTIIDKGCTGAKYSLTTGQMCPISTITTHEGCSGVNKYSSITGQVCINYNGQNIDSDNNYASNIATPIKRTLKIGIKGEDVKTLQAFLNLLADGSFGPKTQAKVIEWQKANGLTPDGAFGNMSRQKANLAE